MSEQQLKYTITIAPEGDVITGFAGETFKSALDRAGIFFTNNCGGEGKCLSCRIEFQSAAPPLTDLEKSLLDPGSSQRMSCQHAIDRDMDIRIPGLGISNGEKRLYDFSIKGGGEGYGVAVDLGTTQVALYLVDLGSGSIISQHSFLNPQMRFGGDVMARLEAAKSETARRAMTEAIHRRVGEAINHALVRAKLDRHKVTRLLVAGNSAMSQLWLGLGGEGLERVPFRSVLEDRGIITFDPEWVGLTQSCRAELCPILSGFVGGDITAAILAADLDLQPDSFTPSLLIDLGTNGEIVLAAKGSIWAASTAAGPAFEGIGMFSGMSALPGAIEGFDADGVPIVIGGGKPVGFCGTGYIAALDLLLRRGIVASSGLLESDSSGERRWSPHSPLRSRGGQRGGAPEESLPPPLPRGGLRGGILQSMDDAFESGMKYDKPAQQAGQATHSPLRSGGGQRGGDLEESLPPAPRGGLRRGILQSMDDNHESALQYDKPVQQAGQATHIQAGHPPQPPFITLDDVRKFQLAKAAVAAGVEILCREAGIVPSELERIILTGSFGYKIDPHAAINLGLLPDIPLERVTFIDNAAGRGAALCLGDNSYLKRASELQRTVRVINLGDYPGFEERFVANMQFPAP